MSRGRSRGFTLLEVMVVLTILALTLTLVVPALSRGMSPSLSDVARELSIGIRQARTAALSAQQTAVFRVDPERHVYIEHSGESRNIPEDIAIRAQVASSEVLAKKAAFRFFADGSSTGGTLLLTQGDQTLAVEVDWLTGKVSIIERGAGR